MKIFSFLAKRGITKNKLGRIFWNPKRPFWVNFSLTAGASAVSVIFVILLGWFVERTLDHVYPQNPLGSQTERSDIPKAPTQTPEPTKVPLEEERIKIIAEHPCEGYLVDILQDLDDALGVEKLIAREGKIVSVPNTKPFQGSKIYPFACRANWIAKLTFTPKSNETVGVFLEWESVFKLLIGDGSMSSWLLEKNDQGRTQSLSRVERGDLSKGPISTDNEVTLTVIVTQEEKWINLSFKLDYVPLGKKDHEYTEVKNLRFKPDGINLLENPFQKFRIGLNDVQHMGTQSAVILNTFSVISGGTENR